MTLDEIKTTLEREIHERETISRTTFVAARLGQKVDSTVITTALTELRCLKRTLTTLKQGG